MTMVKCKDCSERFEVDLSEYDEGDNIDCTECGAEMIIHYDEKGRPKFKTPKEKFMEEDEDFDSDEEDE